MEVSGGIAQQANMGNAARLLGRVERGLARLAGPGGENGSAGSWRRRARAGELLCKVGSLRDICEALSNGEGERLTPAGAKNIYEFTRGVSASLSELNGNGAANARGAGSILAKQCEKDARGALDAMNNCFFGLKRD